ncbi:hypothetical protein ACFU5Y_16270 [Streptomyces gardneri]|uniref:hypothetical protein n=1 Tax=Streptomyces gardneri TaxID=66892 RepID=UPI0036CF5410
MTHRPRTADRPQPLRTVGALKVVAEGVPSGTDPHPPAGPRIVGMLHITLPDRGSIPTSTSRCECVVADHTAHRALCPLLTEGREAA